MTSIFEDGRFNESIHTTESGRYRVQVTVYGERLAYRARLMETPEGETVDLCWGENRYGLYDAIAAAAGAWVNCTPEIVLS